MQIFVHWQSYFRSFLICNVNVHSRLHKIVVQNKNGASCLNNKFLQLLSQVRRKY